MKESVNLLIKEIYFNPIFLIILILFFLTKFFYPKLRGFMGEFWVKQELRKLSKDKYLVLNNIMLRTEKSTHQIDHIVISTFGIFVIEMKNFYGLIVGNEYKDKWSQHLGKNKYYFNNPIHQNYGHIQALKECLNLEENIFIPIICFSNQVKLKVETKTNIVHLDNLTELITSYQNELFHTNLSEIKEKILSLNITDRKARKQHVKDIKNNIKNEENKINNSICPKCGGNLIEKTGRYGKFIGCSNYPSCKYTQKIK